MDNEGRLDPIYSDMLSILHESCDTSSAVMSQLHLQNEIIKKQQESLAEIQDKLNIGEVMLRGVGSLFGAISNSFRPDNSTKNREAQQNFESHLEKKMTKERQKLETTYPTAAAPKTDTTRQLQTQPKTSANINQISKNNLKLQMQDEALDEMYDLICVIKSQAKGINLAVGESIERLDDMCDKTDLASARIKKETQLCIKYKR